MKTRIKLPGITFFLLLLAAVSIAPALAGYQISGA